LWQPQLFRARGLVRRGRVGVNEEFPMATTDSVKMHSYELAPSAEHALQSGIAPATIRSSFPVQFLINNILWFCTLRWVAILILLAFGLLGLVPQAVRPLGLQPAVGWPAATAAILVAANIAFLVHLRMLTHSPTPSGAKANLWSQIILDLLILTVVVHFAGSLETHVAFLYLFHIVLACIFLSRPESMVVTLISCMLYAACVLAESADLILPTSVYLGTTVRESIERSAGMPMLNVVSAQVIWLGVWYLTSNLSAMMREKSHELAETNRRLEHAQEEKTKHMLRTTHELKAPFAAIQANTQLLLKGYCGPLSPDAQDIVLRIAERCRRLAAEIQEMLQLANLQAAGLEPLPWKKLDLAETLRWCVMQVQPVAEEHGIVVETDLQPVRMVAVEDQMKMLFGNVLSNAAVYSHRGGYVRVQSRSDRHGGWTVNIEDDGIGIPPDKIPYIFDEYYRTDEAARRNKSSTGLGLAIVKHVALIHGIRVRVESAHGVGTKFVLSSIPAER